MTLLYRDELFLKHDTGDHPERALRLERVAQQLSQTGLEPRCRQVQWSAVSRERLCRVHDEDYVQNVQNFAARGGGRIEADTVVSRASFDVALHATGAVCDAVDRVLRDEDRDGLCLVRPPGHHARASNSMGFCLFNSIAVGAKLAIVEHELDRVLIVDWDVHHGNGTQDAFWEDEQIGFFSVHRWPFYPGTGAADETGAGRGLGATRNLPIQMGTKREAYHQRFANELEEFTSRIKPQLVLISAGFDAHRMDPIGSLGLESEDFGRLTHVVRQIAATYAEGRIVSVLEGGYNPDMLAESVLIHLQALLEKDQ